MSTSAGPPRIPTIAELLKPLGYATGQFGKNHFGDLNKYLPTVHGFDEFFGNLYHLNAEEEPEQFDYPHKDQFPQALRLGAAARRAEVQGHRRGVQGTRRPEVRPGRQADHRGHRPADRQADGDHRRRHRRRTVDYIKRQHDAGNPFFVWCNFTHMHLYTHTQAGEPRAGRAVAVRVPRRDDRPRQERRHRARRARRTRHRRRHHRHLLHRQRPAPQLLARRGHHAVPQREEHQLGGRLPGSGVDPLAGKDQGGQRLQRHHPAPRLAADTAGRRRRSRRQRQAEEGPQGRADGIPSTRCTSTASTCCRT